MQQVSRYTPVQIKNLRLNTCRNCIYSACNDNGNLSNKCNIDTLVCTKDKNLLGNNKSVVSKANNLNDTCPMGYWDFTNATKTVYIKSSGCKTCGH